MDTEKLHLRHIGRSMIITLLYAAVTLLCNYVVGSYSWGPVQIRVSEALCVLALFTPEAIPGLAFGCAIANIINLSISGLGALTALDIVICLALPLICSLFVRRLRDRPYIATAVVLLANVALVLILNKSFGTLGALDVLLGSVATAIGALFSWKFRERPALAVAGPVIANALIIPAYLPFMLEGMGLYVIPFTNISVEGSYWAMYLFGVVSVAIGEALVMYILGLPLFCLLKGTKFAAWLESGSDLPDEAEA